MKSSHNPLNEHFEQLKALVPELYSQNPDDENPQATQLLDILKRTLRIIEAVYVEDPNAIHEKSLEEYGKAVADLDKLGYAYEGHKALLEKASNQLILQAKKPMQKAKGKKKKDAQGRKAM